MTEKKIKKERKSYVLFSIKLLALSFLEET